MTILSPQTILELRPIKPIERAFKSRGMTGGLSCAGYDILLAEDVIVEQGFTSLASSLTAFDVPNHVAARVHDKSTLIRLGLHLGNTFIEPGWRGKLTLELTFHPLRPTYWRDRLRSFFTRQAIILGAGTPIALVVFEFLDRPSAFPYRGRYQDQEDGPQGARFFTGGVGGDSWETADPRQINFNFD